MDICYITFTADVLSECQRTKHGSLFFLAEANVQGGIIKIKIMLVDAAKNRLIQKCDKIQITNATVYLDDKAGEAYVFNVIINRPEFIHVLSYDDGIKDISKITSRK